MVFAVRNDRNGLRGPFFSKLDQCVASSSTFVYIGC